MIWINGRTLCDEIARPLHGPLQLTCRMQNTYDLSEGSPAATDLPCQRKAYESAWRLARFVVQYDTARLDRPPMK